jgi:hypothetical protein
MIEKEFIPYELALELKQLQFDETCFGWFRNTEFTISFNDLIRKERGEEIKIIAAPTYSQAFRWFREKYDLHVQIRKENYFQKRKYEYYHFDISKGEENDITNQEDLLDEIFNECSQDIPGNHLNDEMYSKLIFEKEFAFKTYEEIELVCLKKLIEIANDK